MAGYLASFTWSNSVMISGCLIPAHSACNERLLSSSTTVWVSNTDISVMKARGRHGGIGRLLLNAWQWWWRFSQQRRLTTITTKNLLIRRCRVQWRHWQWIKVGHWRKWLINVSTHMGLTASIMYINHGLLWHHSLLSVDIFHSMHPSSKYRSHCKQNVSYSVTSNVRGISPMLARWISITRVSSVIYTRDVKLKFFWYSIIKIKKSIFIRLSNYKYNGLKHASLPHCTQVPISNKKWMRMTCYAKRIHICAVELEPILALTLIGGRSGWI